MSATGSKGLARNSCSRGGPYAGDEEVVRILTQDKTGRTPIPPDASAACIVPGQDGAWHHVEMRNIDWSARKFDFYVDGTLVTGAQPFSTTAGSAASRIDIHNLSIDPTGVRATQTFWDDFDIRP